MRLTETRHHRKIVRNSSLISNHVDLHQQVQTSVAWIHSTAFARVTSCWHPENLYPVIRPHCTLSKQEAQLPQRNSASAAHMQGAKPSSPLSLPPLATPMRTVESETRNKRTSSVPSVKRTLSWIGHSRSFKVILICADRNPDRCIVVMSN